LIVFLKLRGDLLLQAAAAFADRLNTVR
jgi:hypothetical protein